MLVSNMAITAYAMSMRDIPVQYMRYMTWPQMLMMKKVCDDLKSH